MKVVYKEPNGRGTINAKNMEPGTIYRDTDGGLWFRCLEKVVCLSLGPKYSSSPSHRTFDFDVALAGYPLEKGEQVILIQE